MVSHQMTLLFFKHPRFNCMYRNIGEIIIHRRSVQTEIEFFLKSGDYAI